MRKIITAYVISRAVTVLTILLIMAMTGLLFYFLSLRLGFIAKENQTYNRYISCVLSVPSNERDQTKIDSCWTTVQEDTGIQVKRYDKQDSP